MNIIMIIKKVESEFSDRSSCNLIIKERKDRKMSHTSRNFAKAGFANDIDLMASLADFQLFMNSIYVSTTDGRVN